MYKRQSYNCGNIGANAVTLTVTDPSGNNDNCSATVTIQDNTAPTAICQNVTIQLNAAGSASTTANDVDNGSNDACGVSGLSLSQATFNCSEAGNNVETLTVSDASGNDGTCAVQITVQDNIAPIAICQDITLQLNSGGTATTTATAIDNGSNDACGIGSLTLSQTTFVLSLIHI